MNEDQRIAFEAWSAPLGYDLAKTPAMKNENPYTDSGTWKAYEAWCEAARVYRLCGSVSPEDKQ